MLPMKLNEPEATSFEESLYLVILLDNGCKNGTDLFRMRID